MAGTLAITGDPDADRLLNEDPLALLLGMMLDQQVPMEWAFVGPYRLQQRLGELDAASVAAMELDELEAAFKEKPALHRYPASMAKRAQALCIHVVEEHDGDAAEIWTGASSASDLYQRLLALPGYGEEKSKIFLALLAKRMGVQPDGWEELAGPFADDTPRSAADIDGPAALEDVRTWKRSQKARGKTKQE